MTRVVAIIVVNTTSPTSSNYPLLSNARMCKLRGHPTETELKRKYLNEKKSEELQVGCVG